MLFNMSLKLCFILLLVPIANANQKHNITPSTRRSLQIETSILQNVFGFPALQAPAAAVIRPVTPVIADDTQQNKPLDYIKPSAFASSTLVENLEENFVQPTFGYDVFDLILTKRVAAASSASENFLLSPLGLKLALAILTEAATGNTRSELATVLGFDNNSTVTRQKFFTILNSLKTNTGSILNIGSRIYLEDYIQPQQQFAAIAEYSYQTEVRKLNFSDTEKAAHEINLWVSNMTNGKIPGLVTPNELEGIVTMILSALYFKGTWSHQFPPKETKTGLFYSSAVEQKACQYMNMRNKFYYAESTLYDAKILRLPYKGNKFSMYIVVPNSLTGLSEIFNTLSAAQLYTEIIFLKERIVDVTIPKFEFDYTSVLDGVLKELGIRQAFEDTASFPKISRGQTLLHKLKVSRVLQRSGIIVDEVGSEAYTATEITLENKFGEDNLPVVEVVANKPFLFFIQDDSTRQLLFTGRMADPIIPSSD